MSRPHIHYVGMGPWPYFVGFTTDHDAFSREMRRIGIKDDVAFVSNSQSDATTHSFTAPSGKAMSIICIRPQRRTFSKEQYAAMVAHEAVHVIQRMGEQLGELGCEAEAYIVQTIVQEGLQVAWRTGREVSRAPSRAR